MSGQAPQGVVVVAQGVAYLGYGDVWGVPAVLLVLVLGAWESAVVSVFVAREIERRLGRPLGESIG